MSVEAPLCGVDGCTRRAWVRGQCGVDHRQRGTSARVSPAGSSSMALPAPKKMMDTWSELREVFPDLGQIATPGYVRDLVHDTLRTAVSTECYRYFAQIDAPVAKDRDDRLRYLRAQLRTELSVVPNQINTDDAIEIANSSADMFGRGLEESQAVISYALRQEWDMGRALKLSTDESGVPYQIPFTDFSAAVNEQLQETIDSAFAAEAHNYAQIVYHLSGHPPMNPAPLAPDLLGSSASDALSGPTPEAVIDQHADAETLDDQKQPDVYEPEVADEVEEPAGARFWSFIARKLEQAEENDQRSEQQRQVAAQQKLLQEQTEYFERANRAANRRENARRNTWF